jgi:hypothetical protein
VVVLDSAKTGDRALDGAVQGIEDHIYQLIIIESLGALLTPAQDDGDVGDRQYGGSSVPLTNFQNKIYQHFTMERPDGTLNETTIIGVNQARANMDAGTNKYAPKTRRAAGAFAWRHGQLVSIELSKGEKIREEPGVINSPVLGREVKWKLTKGKVGTHDGKQGIFPYYHVPRDQPVFWKDYLLYGSTWGVDTITDLVNVAKGLGIVDTSGAWLTWEVNGETIARAQGVNKFKQILVDHEDLADRLRKQCMDAEGLSVRYR